MVVDNMNIGRHDLKLRYGDLRFEISSRVFVHGHLNGILSIRIVPLSHAKPSQIYINIYKQN